MNKKLLLLGIGIVAIIAVACRAKNTTNEVINTDNTETESEAGTTDSQTNSEDTTKEEKIEVPDTEDGEEVQDSEEGNETEERNLNYKDVDIKVPSIHED